MTPAVVGRGDDLEEQRLQRQMGCMAGFFQLFDRHHFINGRCSFSTRRLPTSSSAGSTSPLERSEPSSASLFKESYPPPPSSPAHCASSTENRPAAETPGRRSLPLPLQVFEVNDGGTTSWRIRDGPRFSLDSRLVVDARGKLRPREIRTSVPISSENQFDASEAAEEQRSSPSVVARLMGLDGLPSNGCMNEAVSDQMELRRSASESRVRNKQSSYGLIDANSFREASPPPESAPITAEEFFKSVSLAQFKLNNTEPTKMLRTTESPPLQRKIFDSDDFFPESKRSGSPGSLNGDIRKRLRLRGIEEPAKDMETVKQSLEALQLKALLRSNTSHHLGSSRRKLIYDYHSRLQTYAPIVIMRPVSKTKQRTPRESTPFQPRARTGRQSPQRVPHGLPAVDRAVRGGNERRNREPRSPGPSSAVNRRHFSAAAHSSAQPQRRISTISSPKSSPQRTGLDSLAVRSPRNGNRRPTADASPEAKSYATAEDDTSTTFSESSVSSSSQLECERSNADCSSGRSLLERCDKLLNSIAAFTGAEQVTPADQQPSPVSVLDSLSLLGDEGSPSPSSLSKHSASFKAKSTDDWEWLRRSPPASMIDWDADYEFAYVSKIIRLCERYGDACGEVYAILEKRCGFYSCKGASLHRRLFFDTVAEILDRKRWMTPWDSSRLVTFSSEKELLRHVWGQLRRIQEPGAANMDDAEMGGALRKDIDREPADGWVRPRAETYDAVVHIERLIFKDLVAEIISELGSANADVGRLLPRRNLYF